VKTGAVYNDFCKPQSCQKQKDNYSTASGEKASGGKGQSSIKYPIFGDFNMF